MTRPEAIPEKLTAYLDGEMSEEEARAFERFLDEHPEWREEAAEMAEIVAGLDRLAVKPPPAEVWDNYWEEIEERLTKHIGWIAMGVGGALLAALGTYKILAYAMDPWIRVGLALLIAGFLIVFLSVLRGHLLERPRDRYRKIRR